MKTSIKKQRALIIAGIFLVSTSYAQVDIKVKGNGNIINITKTTSDYESISCVGSFDYILVEGNEGNINVEGEENLLEYITVEVKNNTLIVKVEDHVRISPGSNKTIKVKIPIKEINSVSLAGSGDLWNEDVINSDSFKVSLTGSGSVILDVNANTIEGSLTSSGDLTLKGATNNLLVIVEGSGNFHGSELQSNHTEISISGSGDAKVVSVESLNARVIGSGDIVYLGNPIKKDAKVIGSGSVSNK